MEFKDVKLGMLVRAKNIIGNPAISYVRPNDYGTVIGGLEIGSENIHVRWNDPVNNECDKKWWINPKDIEPAYRKSEMVGNYVKVLRDESEDFTIGKLYKVKEVGVGHTGLLDNMGRGAWAWFEKLPKVFTQSDLKKLYSDTADFEYILAEDVEVPPAKSKLSKIEVPVKIKVELDDEPTIEDSVEDLAIYSGRHTIYYNKELDLIGVSVCHPNDNYDKFIGKAVAYYKAFNK